MILLKPYSNIDFVLPLVEDMIQADPSKRPTMAEVVDRFSKIRSNLSRWKLRSRLALVNEAGSDKILRGIYHSFWAVYQILLRRAAMPNT